MANKNTKFELNSEVLRSCPKKGLGKPPVFLGRGEHFYVWTNKVENCVSGVFPNVPGVLTFAAESQDDISNSCNWRV